MDSNPTETTPAQEATRSQCQATETPSIELAALRERYRRERERRVRPEAFGQYLETADDLAEIYEHDPHTEVLPRDPISVDVDAAILGGGFAGLLAGARLKQAGIDDFRIIDMGGDFGGTWYWNRYPGLQCDVESYLYLPLLDELGYVPKHKYSFGPEVYEHCRRIARHFGLYEHALFSTSIEHLRWDEGLKRWRISTRQGDEIRARFVTMAFGLLHKPKLPGIPGIRSFKGHSFHSSRWDYAYTGGDTGGGLARLADKRVAVIGTGATAIQIVPMLAKDCQRLYVFQRTPSYVAERGNRPTDPEWAGSLRPGWQDHRQRNAYDGTHLGFAPGEPDLICDGWSEINRNVAARLERMGWPALPPAELAVVKEEEEYRAMERLRRRVDEIVHDRETAEALKAWYRFGCKRPCFSDEYLPTFNRPNVTLVDVSATRGVERITQKGLVANGVEYEVDCIVYASGFEFTTDIKRRYGIGAIDGRGGLSLYDHWKDGYQTLHGLMTTGFPNLFFTGYTQGPVGNVTLMYDQQAIQTAYVVKETLRRGALTVEPSEAAQGAWVKRVRDDAAPREQFWRDCTPGLYNSEGSEVFRSPFGDPFAPGLYAFDDLLKAWRSDGRLEGLVLET
jgi:cyclohexanone monooxygenase